MTPYDIAQRELGQAEIPGPADNPRIVEYLQSIPDTSDTHDSTPWCAGFVNWCLKEAGLPTSHSLMARSFLGYGKKCRPVKGCIVILRRGSPPNGHVGFLSHRKDGRVYLLGGNQGDKVSVAGFPESDVLDYRMPSDTVKIDRKVLGAGTAAGGGAAAEAVKNVPPPPDIDTLSAWQYFADTVVSLGSWAMSKPFLTAGVALWCVILMYGPQKLFAKLPSFSGEANP